MTTTLNASTAGAGGFIATSDNSGVLALQTAGTTAITVNTAQNVGIGTTSPIAKLDVVGSVNFGPADGSCVATGTSNTFTPSGGSPTAYYGMTFGGFITNSLSFSGYNGLAFYTNAGLERMRIDSSGNVLVTNAAGLGYGTGAGGTVTQATNKGTAVTLNKPTGQITTNNAALASGATVSFSINNSIITATDNIMVVVTGGSSYTVQPAFVSGGVTNIRLTNTTGGSLSEAVVINFAVIKGATS